MTKSTRRKRVRRNCMQQVSVRKTTFRALFFSAGRSSLDASSSAITNRSYLVHLTTDEELKSIHKRDYEELQIEKAMMWCNYYQMI